MKLTIRRSQEATRKGVAFSALFHLALLPDEMEIVTRYQLQQFSFIYFTLAQALQGYKQAGIYTGDMRVPNLQTQVIADLNRLIKIEDDVKDRCRDLLVALNNLRHFDGSQEFIYERPETPPS